jgi:MOSC domain-containing protein YiiM
VRAVGGALISLNRSLALRASGISKHPVEGSVGVGPFGIEDDAQADLPADSGLSKAINAYPSEHFPFWQTVRAQARAAGWEVAITPGLIGENLTLAGLLEQNAWVGDVLKFPNCELAVSEPYVPNASFNAAMGFDQASKMMISSGWCGFYLAVRQAGSLQAGDKFELLPGPRDVGIAELFRARTTSQRR